MHTVRLYKQEVSHTSRLYNTKVLHFNIQCQHRLGGDGNDLSKYVTLRAEQYTPFT
jgi:hypothetical protein